MVLHVGFVCEDEYTYIRYILVLACTRYRAVAIDIPVEIDVEMTKLAEKADRSRKDRFAACSTLDRAVNRLAVAQRAALIQPSTTCISYILKHCGACALYTHKQHANNHHGCHKANMPANAASCCCILLRFFVYCSCGYSVHGSGCGAAIFEIQFPRSLYRSVVPRSYDTTADCGRKKQTKHYHAS